MAKFTTDLQTFNTAQNILKNKNNLQETQAQEQEIKVVEKVVEKIVYIEKETKARRLQSLITPSLYEDLLAITKKRSKEQKTKVSMNSIINEALEQFVENNK